MQPNTFQGENGGDGHADPTSETPLAMASAVQDMLVFTDDASDAFRVFWGVPASVPEASFHELRVAGAILVSGKRLAGKTIFIAVRATLTGSSSCTFFPPPDWDEKELAVLSISGVSLRKSATVEGAWELDSLSTISAAVVFPESESPTSDDLTIRPAYGDPQFFNWWGYHAGGAGRTYA